MKRLVVSESLHIKDTKEIVKKQKVNRDISTEHLDVDTMRETIQV